MTKARPIIGCNPPPPSSSSSPSPYNQHCWRYSNQQYQMKTVHSPCTVQHHFWSLLAAALDELNKTELHSNISSQCLIIYQPFILINIFTSFPHCYLDLVTHNYSFYLFTHILYLNLHEFFITPLCPIFLALPPYILPSVSYFSYLTSHTIKMLESQF